MLNDKQAKTIFECLQHEQQGKYKALIIDDIGYVEPVHQPLNFNIVSASGREWLSAATIIFLFIKNKFIKTIFQVI